MRLCEHLPLLTKQAHHIALINLVGATVNTNDHHAGYYHNLEAFDKQNRPFNLLDTGEPLIDLF